MPWNIVTSELYWLTLMYTTHQTNKRTLDFFYNIGCFKGTDRTFVTIHYLHSAISFCCECVSTYYRMHCHLKQHNFWNGLEGLAPSSKWHKNAVYTLTRDRYSLWNDAFWGAPCTSHEPHEIIEGICITILDECLEQLEYPLSILVLGGWEMKATGHRIIT